MDLHDRVAIVTGASRGIGKALAVGLARQGAAVVCAARTLEPSGDEMLPGSVRETADAITNAGGRAIAQRCDVGNARDLESLVDATTNAFGRVDVLVNNAMAPTRGSFDDTSL